MDEQLLDERDGVCNYLLRTANTLFIFHQLGYSGIDYISISPSHPCSDRQKDDEYRIPLLLTLKEEQYGLFRTYNTVKYLQSLCVDNLCPFISWEYIYIYIYIINQGFRRRIGYYLIEGEYKGRLCAAKIIVLHFVQVNHGILNHPFPDSSSHISLLLEYIFKTVLETKFRPSLKC